MGRKVYLYVIFVFFVLLFALTILLLSSPVLVFKVFHESGISAVSDLWVHSEAQRAKNEFDNTLSNKIENALNEFGERDLGRLSPYSKAKTSGIFVKKREDPDCYEEFFLESGQVFPLRDLQDAGKAKCKFKVNEVSSDQQHRLFGVLLSDSDYEMPSRLVLIQRNRENLAIAGYREAWFKQYFFTSASELWYARYEDKNSLAPDPCLLWKFKPDHDQCVLWAHELNDLPAYENITFFPGDEPNRIWVQLSGKSTNRLYTGQKVSATEAWKFHDTGIRNVFQAVALGTDLFYWKRDEVEFSSASERRESLWRVSRNGVSDLILTSGDQKIRWSTKNGFLQIILQASASAPAKYMYWDGTGLKVVPLTSRQMLSATLNVGGSADTLISVEPSGQIFSYKLEDTFWREQGLTLHPDGTRSQILRTKSYDGSELECVLLDRSFDAKPKMTLVKVYGAYGINNFPLPSRELTALLYAGVRLVFPQTRGGGGGKNWTNAGRGNGKQKVVEDAEACINETLKMGLAEAGHIVSMGGSAGASIAYWLLQRNPGVIAASVLDRPYLVMTEQKSQLDELEYGSMKQKPERDFLEKFSPYNSMLAGDLRHGRILFLCGERDTVTPDWHCRTSQAALRSRGYQQSWMYIAAESGHGGLPSTHPETQTELRLLVNFVLKAGER